MKLKPLPCRLHPKDKVDVFRAVLSKRPHWLICCYWSSCMIDGDSRHHAITRWNEAQKKPRKIEARYYNQLKVPPPFVRTDNKN